MCVTPSVYDGVHMFVCVRLRVRCVNKMCIHVREKNGGVAQRTNFCSLIWKETVHIL